MAETVGFEVSAKSADPERLAELRALLSYGQTFRDSRQRVWRQSEAQYEGRHWSQTRQEDPTADLITINLSFSTVNTIVPYVTSEEPRFLVSPYSADATVENARLQQAWLNRLWRKQSTGAYEATVSAAEDFLIYGDGYVKVSYEIRDKLASDGSPSSRTVAEIYVDRIDPWDLFIDPMADGISNARWVCHRIYTTRRELEANELYSDVDLDEVIGGIDDISVDDERFDHGARIMLHGDTGQEWVTLYEFYDVFAKEMWTFTLSGDKPLRVVEDVLPPIVQIPNYRIPHSPYHMGELEQIWPMQQELNKSRSQLITHRRRNVAKYLIREDAIAPSTKAALTSPIVNEIVPIKGQSPLESLVKPAQMAALPPEAYNSADQALRDIYEISGVNEYLRGASPEIRRTATEATIIEGASNVKTRAKLNAVERAVRRIGTLIVETAKEIYPETDLDEMALFLTGGEAEQIARDTAGAEADQLAMVGDLQAAERVRMMGAQSDVVVTPTEEIFVGEYEIDVETGSTEMRSPSFKEQKYREMAQTLIQFQQPLAMAGVQVNLRKVMELWFEAAQISDVEGMFAQPGQQQPQPQPQPMGQPMPQQQPQGLPAGPPELPPELAAMLAGDGGIQPNEGVPNTQGAEPPMDPLTALNTGALAPQE